MDYKLLILDIDGTMLNSQHHLTEATYKRLIQLQEAGYYLVLASGRPTASMLETAKELGLDKYESYIISFNGAVITRMSDLQEIYSKRMDVAEQQAIIQFIQENNLSVIAYTEDGLVVDRENENSEVEAELTNLPMRYDAEYIASIDTPQLKFIGVGSIEDVAKADAKLNGKFGENTYATTSQPYFLEFLHLEVNKGEAIRTLVKHLGYTVEHVIACGDGNNDAAMIEVAGVGVAMANGTDYLKSLADEITLSNDEDGLIPVMDKYFR